LLITSTASPSLTRARGASRDEEKLLLYDSALNTDGGRAVVHSMSDCQKYLYCSTMIILRLWEEAKSQADDLLLTV
jgi:hypothetical protein